MAGKGEQAVELAVETAQTELQGFKEAVEGMREAAAALSQAAAELKAGCAGWTPGSPADAATAELYKAEEAECEQGSLQGFLTIAGYQKMLRSHNSQELAIESCCQLKRQTDKLRQLEKAVHFVERRQDSAASLPTELHRHYHQFMQASLEADSKQAATARQQWQQCRRDAVFVGFQGGCLVGMARAVRLYLCMNC